MEKNNLIRRYLDGEISSIEACRGEFLPPSYYQEDAPISPTGSQNKTTAADNNNNNNDDTETTETHTNERNVGKEDMDRDEPHKQWWKQPNNRKGLLVWTAVALLLAFWSWSMSAGDARRSLMIANSPSPKQERILYIITTLAEYNSGTRKTVKGSDRLQETLIPVMSESVQTMLDAGYQVDVFLVCHFILRPERYELVRAALPESVGLEYWNSATPLGYDTGKNPFTKLQNRTLHLARQHRFVIKDKLRKYDMFACFEDDMVIHGAHIDHFIAVTRELRRLRETAPDSIHFPDNVKPDEHYHGPMTKSMLKRMIPGFIRVEVLLDEEHYPAQKNTGPVPIDLSFEDGSNDGVTPEYCCHVSPHLSNAHIPESPTSDKLMLWETNAMPLGVRQMPEDSWLNWVVMLRGPNQGKLDRNAVIGDYWTNKNHKYWPKDSKQGGRRPTPQEFKYINNQGGWMATREQLWEWHTEICPGGFLPPYEAPHYRFDGLDMRNVEWYSGGMQLSTVRHACNMQRIIAIDPKNFSKSLLYHSANNKQQQLASEGKREWFVKANTLLGQLNTIRKQASDEIDK